MYIALKWVEMIPRDPFYLHNLYEGQNTMIKVPFFRILGITLNKASYSELS